MLPRRGYEPLDDGTEDDAGRTTAHSDDCEHPSGSKNTSAIYTSIPAAADQSSSSAAAAGASTPADNAEGRGADIEGGGMMIRVLDVQGKTYPLSVRKESTIHELKTRLIEVAGVEIARQRIIFGGKVLEDSDTLESRKISDGAAIHLFQRPKSATLAGVGTASASQSGRLHEIPPLLLQVQERLRGSRVHSQGQGYLDAHWEVEVPRRSIRFLASFLLLMSVMQLMECLARISAAMGSPATGRGDGVHRPLPPEYWVLVRGRTVSSIMGIVVGVLGVRGSQSLSTRTIKMYFVGLVMCAIVAMTIRTEVLFDVMSGKIPFVAYSRGPQGGRADDHGPSDDDPGDSSGLDGGEGTGEAERERERVEQARTSYIFSTFSQLVAVFVSGTVWLLCIRRVHTMRNEIAVHMDSRERQQREMREEQEREGATSSDARLEEGTIA